MKKQNSASIDPMLSFCGNFSPITEEAASDLAKCISLKTYKKGDYVLKQNQTCRDIYFVNEGLLKLSIFNEKKEFVMRFFSENTMFSAFESYVTQKPSLLSLIAIEQITIAKVHRENMERLCAQHHCIETLFRKLISIASAKMTKRIREMLEADATKRYNLFLQDNNEIVHRLKVGDIAKYLGITQQSLSRIRAAR